uniref:BZIP domain-containing protein n=1 Tax=Bionectria ochroleuca TaxID=29856 RepID=A0A0B7JTK0_BIOOC
MTALDQVSAPPSSSSSASSTTNPKRQPALGKRPNSETRKEQNRLAAQKYHYTQTIAATAEPTCSVRTLQNVAVPDFGIGYLDEGFGSFETSDNHAIQHFSSPSTGGILSEAGSNHITPYSPWASLSNMLEPSSIQQPPSSIFRLPVPSLYEDIQGGQQNTPSKDSVPNENPTADQVSIVLGIIQRLPWSQKRQILSTLLIEADDEICKSTEPQQIFQSIPFSSVDHIESPDSRRLLIRIKREVRMFEAKLKNTLACHSSLPDPRVNLIRVIHSNFYQAIIANSEAIGLFNCEVLKDDGLSPFSIDHGKGHPQDQLEVARARFAARVPPGLAPCDAQLKHAHHPYLDVIPFREFRERAVAALACDPPLFCEEIMCHDMDAEGLVCWGGSPAEQEGTARRGMEMEVPWDPRSWEPKGWFLQKYWFLVGGEDGEMHTSARLWAHRRQ